MRHRWAPVASVAVIAATAAALAVPPPAFADEETPPAAPVVVAPTAPAEPVTTAATATNVNVSIRIGSPGDDGAVTQTVSVTPDGGAGGYRGDTPQYQAPAAA